VIQEKCILSSGGKPEGSMSLGRSRHRWKANIEINFTELGWESMDWINLAEDRDQWQSLLNTIMNLHVQ
jgi:hypothetical protein